MGPRTGRARPRAAPAAVPRSARVGVRPRPRAGRRPRRAGRPRPHRHGGGVPARRGRAFRGDRRDRARPDTDDHCGPRARPHRLEPKACAAAPRLSRRPRSDAQVRRRSDPRRAARAGSRARRYAHRPKEGRSMRFRAVRPSQLGKVDAIVIPLFAGAEPPAWLSRATRAAIARLLKEEQGVTRLYGVNTLHGEPRVVIVGAGKPGQLDAERARNIASAGIRALWRASVRKVAIAVAADSIGEERAVAAMVEGAIYAMWRPEVYRTREEERRLPYIRQELVATEKAAGLQSAIDRGVATGEATNAARRMANEPANRMTPTHLAEAARELAKEAGVRIEVLDADKCRALGMGSYLSVAQGSHEPPRFIVMRHRGRGGSGYDLGLVGKGITFDSGGISIQPADNMHHMKADMPAP